jgi:hypothetical protein
MTRNQYALGFVLTGFLAGNLYFAQDVVYPAVAHRPVTLAVNIHNASVEDTRKYQLGLKMAGANDSITVNDKSITLSGWADPEIDGLHVVSSLYSPTENSWFFENNWFTITTSRRPDVSTYFSDKRFEFSGYVFTLNKDEFGEVLCIFTSNEDEARLLYKAGDSSCDKFFSD